MIMTSQSNQPKYLAIRNWEKFQSPSKNGKSLPWCKLYSAQADDFEYQRLTSFQRGVLHDCYLVVTRTSRNLHNDITWLARTMHTLGTDRPHLQHAIDTLTVRGFLTPTESSNPYWRGEREGEEKERRKRVRGEGEPENSRRIPFSPDPPEGATAKLTDEETGEHVGWKVNGERYLFEGATCR